MMFRPHTHASMLTIEGAVCTLFKLRGPRGALLLSLNHLLVVDREVEDVRWGCQARGRDLARRARRGYLNTRDRFIQSRVYLSP